MMGPGGLREGGGGGRKRGRVWVGGCLWRLFLDVRQPVAVSGKL
jgi:hypothetical protein